MRALDRLKPTCAQLPVGLVRSAFFSALSQHFGLPAPELESALKGAKPEVRAVPKPEPRGPAQAGVPGRGPTASLSRAPGPGSQVAPPSPARPAPERPPEALEARLVALALRNPKLLAKDEHRALDELSHPGLRAALAFPVRPRRQPELEERLSALRVVLGEAAFTDAWEAGQALDWEQAVSEALEDTDEALCDGSALRHTASTQHP